MVRHVWQEPHHFLASAQLQLDLDYKARSEHSRAITKEAYNHVVHYIEVKEFCVGGSKGKSVHCLP